MTVAPIEADAPVRTARPHDAGAFRAALDAAGGALDRAAAAERAFARGRGGLVEAVVERSIADVTLQAAASATSHLAQALSFVLNMQV